jgi:hypothetical protein
MSSGVAAIAPPARTAPPKSINIPVVPVPILIPPAVMSARGWMFRPPAALPRRAGQQADRR